MSELDAMADDQDVAFQWMQIALGIARGRIAPEEGAAKLRELAEANPQDHDWLQEEIDTIRWQFGLDVSETVENSQNDYWDKLQGVLNALLQERLDHTRALALLRRIEDDHPEHAAQVAKLIEGVAESPWRKYLARDEGPGPGSAE